MRPLVPTQEDALPRKFHFDDVEVDVAAHTLTVAGTPRPVEPKSFSVLLVLLRHPGALVGRDALLDEVWGHRHVTPGVLTRAIAQLRAALGDDPQHPRHIQTRHALGYCFVGNLRPDDGAGESPPRPEASRSAEEAGTSAARGADLLPFSPQPRMHALAPGRPSIRRGWIVGGVVLIAGAVALTSWFLIDRGRSRASAAVSTPSIAVLPFTTLSPGAEDRYFAEGLSAEMLSALSGLPDLQVAAWRPPEAVDRTQDVKALGSLLGVATILDANVTRVGDRLRINAMLSDTRTGYTLWSRVYDGGIATVFDIQTDIAQEVATIVLGRPHQDDEQLAHRLSPTRDVKAFDAYLKGVAESMRPHRIAATDASVRHFQEAIGADSGFARAQAALCRAELWRFESQRNSDAFDRARIACGKASDMDGSVGEVDIALGDLYRIQGDLTRASRYYGKWLDDPALGAQARLGHAQVLIENGHYAAAMKEFRLALANRPADAEVLAELGYQQYRLGRYADAIASYRRVVALRPDMAAYWATFGGLLVNGGDEAEARRVLRRAIELEPNASAYANLAELDYRDGHFASAVGLYRRSIALDPDFFLLHGYLADVLDAGVETQPQASVVYARAAQLAGDFLGRKPDDVLAMAALGWYLANLEDPAGARAMALKAESLQLEPGEVAFLNAQTFARIGAAGEARSRFERARRLGVSERRMSSSQVLQRAGLVGPGPRPAGGQITAGPGIRLPGAHHVYRIPDATRPVG